MHSVLTQSFLYIRPSAYVLLSVFGTQLVASLLAVYGGGMTGVGWGKVTLVWAFCVLQFLVFDTLKQVNYRCPPYAAPVLDAAWFSHRHVVMSDVVQMLARILDAARKLTPLQEQFAGRPQ